MLVFQSNCTALVVLDFDKILVDGASVVAAVKLSQFNLELRDVLDETNGLAMRSVVTVCVVVTAPAVWMALHVVDRLIKATFRLLKRVKLLGPFKLAQVVRNYNCQPTLEVHLLQLLGSTLDAFGKLCFSALLLGLVWVCLATRYNRLG